MKLGVSFSACTNMLLGVLSGKLKMSSSIPRIAGIFRVKHLELPADPFILDFTDAVAVMRALSERGYKLSLHLPYMYIDIASLNEAIRRSSVRTIVEIMRVAEPYIETYVLHPYGSFGKTLGRLAVPRDVRVRVEEKILEASRRSISEIIVETGLPPHRIAIENVEAENYEKFWEALTEMGLKICVDVGHLALFNHDPVAVVERWQSSIAEFHIHDVRKTDGSLTDHREVGTGLIDWRPMVRLLTGLSAPAYIEVRDALAALKSLKYLRQLTRRTQP